MISMAAEKTQPEPDLLKLRQLPAGDGCALVSMQGNIFALKAKTSG